MQVPNPMQLDLQFTSNLPPSDVIRLQHAMLCKWVRRNEGDLKEQRRLWRLGAAHFARVLQRVPEHHPDELESYRAATDALRTCVNGTQAADQQMQLSGG